MGAASRVEGRWGFEPFERLERFERPSSDSARSFPTIGTIGTDPALIERLERSVAVERLELTYL